MGYPESAARVLSAEVLLTIPDPSCHKLHCFVHTPQERIKTIMLHCFTSVKHKLEAKLGYFELYGYDFMVDTNFNVSGHDS